MTENMGAEILQLPRPEDISLDGWEEIRDSPLAHALERWINRDPDQSEKSLSIFANVT
ncbi:hypothetical protein BJ973_007780 [Actinoplanes tereljensis]|uniref:Uncharacterized protein n=1 Tax=Paractinoplanes tereljensis TaxID=571912 RepID=A0A919NSE1_9ACTN|nr:hypothetical protein [Actinoplanes tereljensis]GIF24301.1 hypothetical protein Ate02nite_70310 [Actinoplanes tereljensis]